MPDIMGVFAKKDRDRDGSVKLAGLSIIIYANLRIYCRYKHHMQIV